MNDRAIYPASFAEMLVARAGHSYQPSNGDEGEAFLSNWCRQCARDRSMREDEDIGECDDGEVCEIIGNTMAYRLGEPGYPTEWIYGRDGQPKCTAFSLAGTPIPPPRCEATLELFEAPMREGDGS